MAAELARPAELPVTTATLRCPHCAATTVEDMPSNACVWFFACPHCGVELKPLPGDCCVFCSYADVKCPPQQTDGGCCGGGVDSSPRSTPPQS